MPLVITDVSSFDEAGAQLVRLDAHFQTDCRARRARLHHVLPSPRMRALKGMWRSVAAGEGEDLHGAGPALDFPVGALLDVIGPDAVATTAADRARPSWRHLT